MGNFVEDVNFLQMSPDDFLHVQDEEAMHLDLFVQLMRQFYECGWMKGSGGALGCIAQDKLFISPSALQKERLKTSDIFVYDLRSKQQVQRPSHAKVDVSACSVLFSLIMRQTGSKCVIHTHGKWANLMTQLLKNKDVFEISHQEYIKGIYDPFTGKNLNYEDTLTIPIIENQAKEEQLLPAVQECLLTNQRTCAMLVRNHGLFVWGLTWEKTKIMTECIDYLLDLSIEMTRHNIPLVKDDVAMERSMNPDEEYRHIFYSQ